MLQVTIFSVPPEKAELGLGSRHRLLYSAPRESGAEKEKNFMYQNRVSIIGFVGNDAPPSQKIRSLAADNSSAPGVSSASSLPSVRTHWCRR